MFATAGKNKAAAPKVDLSGCYGPDCKKWLGPNIADSYVPDYLAGEYPGDNGWDSAALAVDPKTIEHLRKAEVLHDHWGMVGTLWCLTPEHCKRTLPSPMVPAKVCGSRLVP